MCYKQGFLWKDLITAEPLRRRSLSVEKNHHRELDTDLDMEGNERMGRSRRLRRGRRPAPKPKSEEKKKKSKSKSICKSSHLGHSHCEDPEDAVVVLEERLHNRNRVGEANGSNCDEGGSHEGHDHCDHDHEKDCGEDGSHEGHEHCLKEECEDSRNLYEDKRQELRTDLTYD